MNEVHREHIVGQVLIGFLRRKAEAEDEGCEEFCEIGVLFENGYAVKNMLDWDIRQLESIDDVSNWRPLKDMYSATKLIGQRVQDVFLDPNEECPVFLTDNGWYFTVDKYSEGGSSIYYEHSSDQKLRFEPSSFTSYFSY